jgi:hypothetical protein
MKSITTKIRLINHMGIRNIFQFYFLIPYMVTFLLFSCAEDTPPDIPDLRYETLGIIQQEYPKDLAFSPYIANRYLHISEDENTLYDESPELLSMSIVIIPEGENYTPGNYSFGYPVAAMVDSTIVLSTQRKLVPGQIDDNSGKGQFCIISDNYGKDWGDFTELQQLQPYGYAVGELSCIGTFDNKFIQKAFGVLVSEDKGDTWLSSARAFKYALQDWESYGYNTPQIINHPEFGLIFFTGTNESQNSISIFVSIDNGLSWKDTLTNHTGVDEISCISPSAMLFDDGSILIVASDGINMVQYFYKYEAGDTYMDITFEVEVIENIHNSTGDFADLILNPVNGRIEMIEGNSLVLRLWSISPDEIVQGSTNWTKECILLERQSGLAPMHPAGSVVDEENGVQRIFIYIGGEYPDRNCIFQIIRSLNTNDLSSLITSFRS